MKPNGSALTLTVCRREKTHFQKPLSNGTPVPKLLNIFGWWFTVPMERWLLLILQTCPNHLSKSPCELRFSRIPLPESHAQCVLIHTGTPDSQVRFGQKGCISKTVVDKGAFIQWWSMVHLCKQAGKQAAGKKQARSRQEEGKKKARSSSKQQQAAASSSKQQPAAGKQQASSKQATTSVCPLERMIRISFQNKRNTKIELFPGARPQNNEIVQLLKVVVMPNLNFFQAHGLPIRLLRADTT